MNSNYYNVASHVLAWSVTGTLWDKVAQFLRISPVDADDNFKLGNFSKISLDIERFSFLENGHQNKGQEKEEYSVIFYF